MPFDGYATVIHLSKNIEPRCLPVEEKTPVSIEIPLLMQEIIKSAPFCEEKTNNDKLCSNGAYYLY